MSGELPAEIREPVVRSLLGDDGVAWAIVEDSGVVRSAGGAWRAFVDEPPEVGERVVDRLEVLEGLLPAGAVGGRLSRLELHAGRFVDLHFGPLDAAAEDGASFVLLRDVSTQALAETRLLRRANELSLLRRALGQDLEVRRSPAPERLAELFGEPDGARTLDAWTACVRLDPAVSPSERVHWSRWIEEWLLERSAVLQRRGRTCFLALFGALPEETSPARAARECLLELRESLLRQGFDAVTFALAFGATEVRLVSGGRLLWEGEVVERAWRLARSASRGQLRLGRAAVEAEPEFLRDGVLVPGRPEAWLHLAPAEDVPDPGAVLASLGFLVLRPTGGAAFRVEGPVPIWFERVAGEPRPSLELAVDELFPFLEVFVEEAHEVWSRAQRGLAHSGVWSQDDARGLETYFEATALRTGTGERYLLVQAVDRQIEERRTLLQGVHASRLDLERQRKTIDRREVLLHCIVHDLRGPLANVLAAITGLERSLAGANEIQREMIHLGKQEAVRQDEMIRSLLEVFAAEIESLEGFETSAAQAPDGLAAVRDVGESFRAGFEEAGVRLTVDLDPLEEADGVGVVGRMDRLQRVLANLLENARRHAPAGSEVRVRARRDAGGVRFEVVDQGPGVSAEVSGVLFDRFQKGTVGGAAGLGLFFCRTTVERWGGRIGHAPGPEGQGACFWFWLPEAR